MSRARRLPLLLVVVVASWQRALSPRCKLRRIPPNSRAASRFCLTPSPRAVLTGTFTQSARPGRVAFSTPRAPSTTECERRVGYGPTSLLPRSNCRTRQSGD